MIKSISVHFHFTQKTLIHLQLFSSQSLPLLCLWPPPHRGSGPFPALMAECRPSCRSQQAALWQCASPLVSIGCWVGGEGSGGLTASSSQEQQSWRAGLVFALELESFVFLCSRSRSAKTRRTAGADFCILALANPENHAGMVRLSIN